MPKKNGLVIDINGVKRWYKDDKLDRDHDLPAVIYPTGTQCWYKDGKFHRDNDLPAIIYADGTQLWYVDGRYIKSTGPCPIRAQAIAMQKDMLDLDNVSKYSVAPITTF